MSVSFETFSQTGDLLVLQTAFGTRAATLQDFWVPLCSPAGEAIAFVRFERRISLNSKALFAATEVRSASAEGPRPEPLLSGASGLPLGGQ
jgi:predicted molibdopterin-dependent oxidoreductase YjgC